MILYKDRFEMKEPDRGGQERLRSLLQEASLSFNEETARMARVHWNKIQHPLNGLGLLEDAIVRIAGLTGNSDVCIDKKAVVVFCSDNGVTKEGVTQTDSSVTGIVANAFAAGKTSVCRMAERAGADVIPVDMGILDFPGTFGVLDRRIGNGTEDILSGPAMSREDAVDAILTGVDLADELKRMGYQLLGAGEMGIGNTTTASACAAVLFGKEVPAVTGKGAGLSDEGLKHKIEVVTEAIRVNGLNIKSGVTGGICENSVTGGICENSGINGICENSLTGQIDAIEVLRRVGGYDLLGMCGLYLGGLISRIPVLIDGMASCVSALAAALICPQAKAAMFPSHVSSEPAGRMLLDTLGMKPLITAGLHLGEGTGAVLAMPLLDMAAAVYSEGYTFDEGGVEAYKPL